jgi:hypothetical protein
MTPSSTPCSKTDLAEEVCSRKDKTLLNNKLWAEIVRVSQNVNRFNFTRVVDESKSLRQKCLKLNSNFS